MKQVKLTVVIFSFRGEEDILSYSLMQLHDVLPQASIHVFDDAGDPMRPNIVSRFETAFNVKYKKTTFDRKKNLNGKECVVGELGSMVEAMDADNNTNGFVIKMDPDTLVLRPDIVLEAIQKGVKWISHSSCNGFFAGMFYAMHRTILDKVYANAKVVEFPEDCPEDSVIGALCYLSASRSLYSWTDVSRLENRKKFAAFPIETYGTQKYWKNIAFIATTGHIVTVGNTGILGFPKSYQTVNALDLITAFKNPAETKEKLLSFMNAADLSCEPLEIQVPTGCELNTSNT